MTRLRQQMRAELQRRHYSPATTQIYLLAIRQLAAYFRCPPDQLGPEQIRDFQLHLFQDRKLAPHTVKPRTAALRFFFRRTLQRPQRLEQIPVPKAQRKLPCVLSSEQVTRLIDSSQCGHQAISYNSCRHRHCPKCQTAARERWLAVPSAATTVPRRTTALVRGEAVPSLSALLVSVRLGGLCQEALWWTRTCSALSGPLHGIGWRFPIIAYYRLPTHK